jgi:hypothetical protein
MDKFIQHNFLRQPTEEIELSKQALNLNHNIHAVFSTPAKKGHLTTLSRQKGHQCPS